MILGNKKRKSAIENYWRGNKISESDEFVLSTKKRSFKHSLKESTNNVEEIVLRLKQELSQNYLLQQELKSKEKKIKNELDRFQKIVMSRTLSRDMSLDDLSQLLFPRKLNYDCECKEYSLNIPFDKNKGWRLSIQYIDDGFVEKIENALLYYDESNDVLNGEEEGSQDITEDSDNSGSGLQIDFYSYLDHSNDENPLGCDIITFSQFIEHLDRAIDSSNSYHRSDWNNSLRNCLNLATALKDSIDFQVDFKLALEVFINESMIALKDS